METMANFFESINRFLGVSGPGELIFHPVFVGLCVGLFIYGILRRKKFLTLALGGLMGSALIFHYLYPKDSSNLTELIAFIAAMGILSLLVVYLAFVRE